MSAVQTWHDEKKGVYVEWTKDAPHWRMHHVLRVDASGISYTEMRGYATERAATRAAKRLAKQIALMEV